MKNWKSTLMALCACSLGTQAQDLGDIELPRTNIVIADMLYDNGNFYFSNIKKVASEEDRYENQPRFTIDGSHLLFSKEYRKKGKRRSDPEIINTEICQYKMNGGKISRLTRTPEYEFSPVESKYLEQITAVQLDEEGKQYIASYDERGQFQRDEMLNGETVGYYSWLNAENILIYALPAPATLKWINVYSGEEQAITSKIGRTIEFSERDNCVYYVDKSGDEWALMKIDINALDKGPEKVINLPAGVEDFTMLNDASFISCYQGKLYHYAPGRMGIIRGEEQKDWRLIADLDRLDMPTQITRITVNPENSAIVMVVDEADDWFEDKRRR